MPGILPMKVIRVGSQSQSRIAQACDRCRSKKIRCDGIRPCCTQCGNVGFECKTSDKLSRRAFPRGYTESLEDRVRGLEAEVRELKDLLDEKDEKIDMLSRIHSFSSPSRANSSSLSPAAAETLRSELKSVQEEVLEVEVPPSTLTNNASSGPTSTAVFIESFSRKAEEFGKDVSGISATKLTQISRPLAVPDPGKPISKIPPRLLSDQYINIFFQEWAPLLPVLHRPSFLRVYEDFLSNPEAGQWHSDKQAVAQLFLIFEIAALSTVSRIKQSTTSYESQWRKALQSTSSTASLATLQCHILAQLYHLLKSDYHRLVRHRAIAVSICHQLGLHQKQNYASLGPLEVETRKKVFWSQYVLDKYTSAASGAPMLLREADISTEYPRDIDDENLCSDGFSPCLPGELTKISSALALFRGSRILAKALDELYSAAPSYRVSLQKLRSLSDDLEQWLQNLPNHLRLRFVNDKPSTGTISDRSPLLSLAYFFTRNLIHRPLVCHGSGKMADSSMIVLADSAKHTTQILELLDERRMNYTFLLNKAELCLTAGFTLLWQCLGLPSESKLVKDNQKSLGTLVDVLTRDSVSTSMEFQSIAKSFVNIGRRIGPAHAAKQADTAINAIHVPSRATVADPKKSPRKQLQAIASRFTSFNNKVKVEEAPRRATLPRISLSASLSPPDRTSSLLSLPSHLSTTALPTFSPPKARPTNPPANLNLDYLPMGEGDNNSSSTTLPPKTQMNESAWEQLLTNIDSGQSNIYSGIYGGVSPVAKQVQYYEHDAAVTTGEDWAREAWPVSAIDLSSKGAVPQSVFSFSDESLTSTDDLTFSAPSSNNGSNVQENGGGEGTFKGIAIPNIGGDFGFDEFDTRY